MPDSAPDADHPTTIAITSDAPLLLAAFRDGSDPTWHAATMKTPTSYEIAVHGAYVLAVAYDAGDATSHSYGFDQYAQTLDDDHAIMLTTKYAPPTGSAVTGTIVQPGRVFMGDAIDLSSTMANWNLAMTVAPGPHDFFAFSADHALAHHALDATHDVALGTVDINATGTLMNTVAFTAANKTASEVLTSRAAIETPTTFFASVTKLSDANATKVVPDSLLVATDTQSVSVFATDGNHQRTMRQPYHAGVSTAYTLPSLLGGVTWTTTPDLAVRWTTLGTVTAYYANAFSETSNAASYSITLSPSYLSATNVKQFTFDTSIPGFQAAWKIDLTQQYQRSISVQNAPAASTVASETYTDDLNAPPAAAIAPHRRLPRGAAEP